jgi:putative transposase
MSRRARLHVPGGLYYVTQRGNARQPVFLESSDYAAFESLLSAMLARCRMRVHAFCWTGHSLHFAVEISDMPLGRLMQRLTSQYAREIHRRHGWSGHLFQQRYQAVLVDPLEYLPGLVRHIHTVPVRAGLVADVGAYPLSSHHAYLGMGTPPWLTTHAALRILGRRSSHAREAYRQLMLERPDAGDDVRFERGGGEDPRVLGDPAFMSLIPRDQRVIRSARSLEQVIDTVSRTLAVDRGEIFSRSRQRQLTLARALIAWYATQRGIATLAEVGRCLSRDPSTLFVAVERYKALRPELFSLEALHDAGPLLPLS